MLKQLLDGLAPEESVKVSLRRDKKGTAILVLTAEFNFDPDEKNEAIRQLHAAIARPLVVRLDRGDDADTVIREAIASFTAEQRSSRDTLKAYKADQVSSRAAVQTAAKPKAKADTPAEDSKAPEKKAADSNPAPAPEAADSNPACLF